MKNALLAFLAVAFVALAAAAQAQKTAGEVVDDNTINASVKAELFGNENTPSGQINVETYKGMVLLSGFVETQAQKAEAGKVAQGVSGVTMVHNDIALQPATSMGAKLDDSVITGRVKAALLDDKDVKSGQINVETKNGVVQLAGFVDTARNKTRAVEVAKGVSGVKGVLDAMYVRQ